MGSNLKKYMEDLLEMKKEAHEEECADEKVKCDFCKDTGYITKTEWVGEDTSYDVEVKCFDCNE